MRWLLLLLLHSCTTVQGHTRPRLANCTVSGDEIVCGGNPFAQLVCLNRVARNLEREPEPPALPSSGPRSCRALGIHYYDDDTVVWLYRAPGFDPDRPDLPFREARLDPRRAVSVVLSPDGSKLRFRTGSVHPLEGKPVYKSREYDVFQGTLNDD